eukprot:653680-Rhodomonas_salina.3
MLGTQYGTCSDAVCASRRLRGAAYTEMGTAYTEMGILRWVQRILKWVAYTEMGMGLNQGQQLGVRVGGSAHDADVHDGLRDPVRQTADEAERSAGSNTDERQQTAGAVTPHAVTHA